MSTPLTDKINELIAQCNTADGGSDTTLSAAIATLISGYGGGESEESYDLFEYAVGVAAGMYSGVTIPSQYTMRFRNLTSVNAAILSGALVTDTLTVTFDNNPTKLRQMFYNALSAGESFNVVFNCDTSECTDFSGMFQSSKVAEVDGEFDFSSATNVSTFAYGCSTLKEIRFKENSLSLSIQFANAPLSDASLVSIANGLNPSVSGQTVDLKSDRITRCSEIVGAVIDGTFTADENGDMTLADFIVNEKGWSLI